MGILTSAIGQLEDSRLMADILNQPASLEKVLSFYREEGSGLLTCARDLIRGATRTLITGMGASLYAAVGFESSLAALGVNTKLRDTAEILHYRDNATHGTLVIAISRSGETVEIVNFAKHIKELGTRLIAVTAHRTSSLATLADVVLEVPSHLDGDMAIQSYTATLLVLNLLASHIQGDVAQAHRSLQPLILGMPGFVARMLKEAHHWDDFFDPNLPLHFLGRGPSYASALEAAMLWNETAKQPALSMTAGNFRHGHIEVVDHRFRAVIFAPDGKTGALNLALARAIDRFGGKVLVIAPEPFEGGTVRSIATLRLPEAFAPLIDIVPIQIAAARIAAIKGLPVGILRHAQPVTLDEIEF